MAGFFSFFRKKPKNEDKKTEDKLQKEQQEQLEQAAQQEAEAQQEQAQTQEQPAPEEQTQAEIKQAAEDTQAPEAAQTQAPVEEQSKTEEPQAGPQSVPLEEKAAEQKVEPSSEDKAEEALEPAPAGQEQPQLEQAAKPAEQPEPKAPAKARKTRAKKSEPAAAKEKADAEAKAQAGDAPKQEEAAPQKTAAKKKHTSKKKSEAADKAAPAQTDTAAVPAEPEQGEQSQDAAPQVTPEQAQAAEAEPALPRRGKRKAKAKKEQKKAQAVAEQKDEAQPDAEVTPAEEPQDKAAPGQEQAAETQTSQDAVEKTAEEIPAEGEAQDRQAGEDTQTEAKSEEALSFFARLKKTRDNLAIGISAFVKGREIDDDLYDDLETALLTADLGVETTQMVIEKLRNEAKLRELHDAALLKKRLALILYELLEPCEVELNPKTEDGSPFVILMVGVNGAGKTTTIGKLAAKFQEQGLKVMLAAGDTFRAAAVEQLKEWGQRAGVPVIAQDTGSDSASVLYDALSSAKARKADVLICDTAGRLQNKENLMNELKKIVRVLKKIDEKVPHEVLLVLDAATGQNAVSQTRLFKEAVDVTGLCLTKLDGSAKGGVVFALASQFKLPIRYAGMGEKASDLRVFKVKPFVDALLDL